MHFLQFWSKSDGGTPPKRQSSGDYNYPRCLSYVLDMLILEGMFFSRGFDYFLQICSTSNCTYYQLERSGGQEYSGNVHGGMLRRAFLILTDWFYRYSLLWLTELVKCDCRLESSLKSHVNTYLESQNLVQN